MNFEGIGTTRKEEMFFNIIFLFTLVYNTDNSPKRFLYFLFVNHPPLAENSFRKKFKDGNKIKLKNVKEYMGLLYKIKTSERN